MFTAKHEQARIIGQIQGCYSNAPTLVRPTINQIEFEKAIKEDKIQFYFEEVIKSFAGQALSSIEKETDEVKKSEILLESKNQLSPLEKINVIFDNVSKSIYVDVIDSETNTYKDNAINRKFERVGSAAIK